MQSPDSDAVVPAAVADERSPLNPVSPEAARRRLRLRVAAKMMAYLGVGGVVYVLLSAIFSGGSTVPDVPGLRVDITNLARGEAEFLTWEGRPVVVYRRLNTDIAQLRAEDSRLRDFSSAASEQPDFAKNAWRSANPDYFVAIGLSTGRGCTLEFLPPSDAQFQGQAWQGGFKDRCGDDRFDLAGRVFRNQYASENLRVPDYVIDQGMLVLGGR